MKGRHNIIVRNKKLHYEFEIKRNITVIQGDSATGKTTLIDMLRQYENYGTDSGVSVECDVPCAVLEGREWKISKYTADLSADISHIFRKTGFSDETTRGYCGGF